MSVAQQALQAVPHQHWAVQLPSAEAEETFPGGVHKPRATPGPSVPRESCC